MASRAPSLEHRTPRVTPDAARRVAEEVYGLPAPLEVTELPGERDRNLRVTDGSGRRWVLKFTELGLDPEVLTCRHGVLDRLHEREDRYRFPRVRETADGRRSVRVQDADGRPTRARLAGWIPGIPLARSRPHDGPLLSHAGRMLGAVSRHLEGFEHPAADRPFKWDLRRARALVERHAGGVESEERRRLVERAAAMYDDRVRPRAGELRTQVIHGDGNHHNLLVGLPAVGSPAGREVGDEPAGGDGGGALEGRGSEHPVGGRARDERGDPTRRSMAGLVDFGDVVRSWTVADPAVAAAYVMLEKTDPLTAAAHLTRGFHEERPLSEAEIDVLFPLAILRLAASVVQAAVQAERRPENEYLTVTAGPAWRALERLLDESPDLARCRLRSACGLSPSPRGEAVAAWLEGREGGAAPILGGEPGEALREGRHLVFDLTPGSLELADLGGRDGPEAWTDLLFGRMERAGVPVGIGRWNEPRRWYTHEAFRTETDRGPEWRTIHLGLDLFAGPGTPVLAPLTGRVHALADNGGEGDYGPTVVLAHRLEPSGEGERAGQGAAGSGDLPTLYTLYGHLARETLEELEEGAAVAAGGRIGAVGAPPENGGWAPHLHFQLIAEPAERVDRFPGVARPAERDTWRSLSPDPNRLLGIPGLEAAGRAPPGPGGPARPGGRPEDEAPSGLLTDLPAGSLGRTEMQARRDRLLGRNLSVHYRRPIHVVRGWMQHLYDARGQAYLDCVNNVAHVGHSHPRVTEAVARQSRVLNTNTRYLHEHLVRYAERLLALFPDPLSVCYLTCSGSEANELALRLARAHAAARGRAEARGVVVVEGAYHGNTTSLIELSPYKYRGPGGSGRPDHVREVPMPDPYRGRYRGGDPDTAARYADHVRRAAEELERAGTGPAAFFCESLLSCGGQIVLPDGYLRAAYRHAREAGAVCVADEVQVGFGRIGEAFWGFESQDVVPDVVTMGKPMGNGHPLAGVVTTPEIAGSVEGGMEYFNTFGGNPVSCLAGLAVLDVIRDEELRERAGRVGSRLLGRLEEVGEAHPRVVGDIRGMGLFVGVELVRDAGSRAPAPRLAEYVVERLRDRRILLSTDGPDHNVIKIKPPLQFTGEDADRVVRALDRVLAEDLPRAVAGRSGADGLP